MQRCRKEKCFCVLVQFELRGWLMAAEPHLKISRVRLGSGKCTELKMYVSTRYLLLNPGSLFVSRKRKIATPDLSKKNGLVKRSNSINVCN